MFGLAGSVNPSKSCSDSTNNTSSSSKGKRNEIKLEKRREKRRKEVLLLFFPRSSVQHSRHLHTLKSANCFAQNIRLGHFGRRRLRGWGRISQRMMMRRSRLLQERAKRVRDKREVDSQEQEDEVAQGYSHGNRTKEKRKRTTILLKFLICFFENNLFRL